MHPSKLNEKLNDKQKGLDGGRSLGMGLWAFALLNLDGPDTPFIGQGVHQTRQGGETVHFWEFICLSAAKSAALPLQNTMGGAYFQARWGLKMIDDFIVERTTNL